jgi:hypothetical protein
LLKAGLPHPPLDAVLLALQHLRFHQQRQAFFKGQFVVLGLCQLDFQSLAESRQPQLGQLVEQNLLGRLGCHHKSPF